MDFGAKHVVVIGALLVGCSMPNPAFEYDSTEARGEGGAATVADEGLDGSGDSAWSSSSAGDGDGDGDTAGDGDGDTAGDGDGDTPGDGDGDTPGDGDGDTMACALPQTTCGGQCTHTDFDNQNCGSCGKTCVQSLEICTDGHCECVGDNTKCGGSCVNTMIDANNCGGCGSPCMENQLCSNGSCVSDCDNTVPDECGASCTNTQTDPSNCGVCGKKCWFNFLCILGTCI